MRVSILALRMMNRTYPIILRMLLVFLLTALRIFNQLVGRVMLHPLAGPLLLTGVDRMILAVRALV